MRRVYMDNNATTPIHPEVMEVLKESLDLYGNASSHHSFGTEAREKVEEARASVARLIGAQPEEIVFNSGGSEGNNYVVKGVTCEGRACSISSRGNHIITSSIEHPSVLNVAKCVESLGVEVTYLPVDQYGLIDPDGVEKAVKDNTCLISIMFGNNEVGTIEPIEEIAEIAKRHDILFHTDAVQAVGKIPVDVNKLGVDFLTLSGHKIYGPKGVGALYVRKGRKICPLIEGGHQEMSLRAGTENTLGIIGLGKAAEVAAKEMPGERKRLTALRDGLYEGLAARVEETRLNGHPTQRLPGTANIGFKYVEGESILLRLDMEGIAVSTGSACTSDSLEPSHVLLAMGIPPEEAHGSMRFSLGRENTDEDVDYVLEKLPPIVQDLRQMSPLYAKK
ncbi:MAG: cysteine desulfurase [Planctomycetes bacterium DG_23]|nr:MAG: cysteine desulfurase [Planctomycetes bacterium DG_23]